MPLLTPCVDLPYPEDTDPIDVAGDIAALALAVDAAVCAGALPVGAIVPWWDTGGPLPAGMLRLDGSGFNGATYPLLQAHLGSTTLPDLRGRFLRGTDGVGGSFPTPGQNGGFADAQLPLHSHGLNAHTHTINHDHAAFTSGSDSHAHAADPPNTSTTTAGSHLHGMVDGLGSWVFGTSGSGYGTIDAHDGGVVANAALDTFVDHPGHAHSVNIGSFNTGSDSHAHTIDMPAYTGISGQATGNTGDQGVSATNRNLPPFTNVTFLIQAQ